jgi:alpha-D-ribose 1-methylphosphonate 5-triphosphate synthase subunit PhnH
MIDAAFAEPVLHAQATFRAVLDATARPGTVVRLTCLPAPPRPLTAAAAALALTLCDPDTPIWLDPLLSAQPAVAQYIRFHTGARVVEQTDAAAFAFISTADVLPPFEQFNAGTPEYPDRSATLVLQVRSFAEGTRLSLTGPGIRERRAVRISPLPTDLPARLAINRQLFPQGLDLLLATDCEVMALPRSVHVSCEDG